LNPIEKAAVSGAATLANGNLDIQGGATEQFRAATIPVSSGKWYFEIVQSAGSDLLVTQVLLREILLERL
jgi:hypothetical protein